MSAPRIRAERRAPALQRLDAMLIERVFQPTADALGGRATPAEASRFFLVGAMVLLLARMLASMASALPDWTVAIDLAALWGGAALMRTVGDLGGARMNPLRERFGTARPVMAMMTIMIWALGATSLEQSLGAMQLTLWCAALYFASCDTPSAFQPKGGRRDVGDRALVRVRATR